MEWRETFTNDKGVKSSRWQTFLNEFTPNKSFKIHGGGGEGGWGGHNPLELKGGTNKSGDVVGDFKSLLSIIAGKWILEFSKYIEDLKNSLN